MAGRDDSLHTARSMARHAAPVHPKKTALPRDLRIGCAGWSIASPQKPLFGDGTSMLARYATRFDMVEINSSFYRPHQRKTYERWADSVPQRFRFAAKVPKAITHEARLERCGDALSRFCEECTGLGDKLGVLLVQLPPSFAFDARVVSRFFAMARRRVPDAVALVCEPRHPSWIGPHVDALLRRYDVNVAGADPNPIADDCAPRDLTPCRYWRLHGSPRIYCSDYDDAFLTRIAALLRASAAGASHWVVFDNTALGHAVPNAIGLSGKLGR